MGGSLPRPGRGAITLNRKASALTAAIVILAEAAGGLTRPDDIAYIGHKLQSVFATLQTALILVFLFELAVLALKKRNGGERKEICEKSLDETRLFGYTMLG